MRFYPVVWLIPVALAVAASVTDNHDWSTAGLVAIATMGLWHSTR